MVRKEHIKRLEDSEAGIPLRNPHRVLTKHEADELLLKLAEIHNL